MQKRKLLSVGVLAIAGVAIISGCRVGDLTTTVAKAVTARPTPIPNGSITIAAVGDIMLGSTSINESFLPPNDGRDMLKAVTPVIAAADIAFGNLEGPMLEGGTSAKCAALAVPNPTPTPTPNPNEPPKPIRCFAFRMPTHYGQYLKDAGFDVLSLANNHSLDFGDIGRISTRKVLDELGIKHAGSDRNKYSTAYLEAKGKTIAFIGFAHNTVVPNVNDLVFARQLVTAARKKADIVVVSFHGGAEGIAAQNVPRQTEMYVGEKRGNLPLFSRTVIDAGADLVLGHGPHVLRGMEIYKGRLIIYSMGNFATYGMFNLKGAQGISAIFEITLGDDGKFLTGRIHPTKQEARGIPVLDPTAAAIKKLRQLSTADFGRSAPKISDDGTISGDRMP